MKTNRQIPILLAALIFAGCATVKPGNDAVLVNAERTTALAFDTFDTFFTLERQNDAFVKESLPAVHKFANDLRRNAKKYLDSARAATEAYRLNRTPENEANLNTWIAVLRSALDQVHNYTAEITTAKGP